MLVLGNKRVKVVRIFSLLDMLMNHRVGLPQPQPRAGGWVRFPSPLFCRLKESGLRTRKWMALLVWEVHHTTIDGVFVAELLFVPLIRRAGKLKGVPGGRMMLPKNTWMPSYYR